MTTQETENLRSEIAYNIDVLGKNFISCNWLDDLSDCAKSTLTEYFYDCETIGKRSIAMMLYKKQDKKIWDLIMSHTPLR